MVQMYHDHLDDRLMLQGKYKDVMEALSRHENTALDLQLLKNELETRYNQRVTYVTAKLIETMSLDIQDNATAILSTQLEVVHVVEAQDRAVYDFELVRYEWLAAESRYEAVSGGASKCLTEYWEWCSYVLDTWGWDAPDAARVLTSLLW